MKNALMYVGAVALAGSFALPVLAQTDVAAWTCGEFFALDAGGRNEATNAVTNYVNDTANAATTSAASQAISGMTMEQTLQVIEKACEGQPVDTNLLSVLK